MRNPWRFSFDRTTGDLYVGDVGQGAREEIDIVTRGGNYGWKIMEGSICNPNLNGGVCTPPPDHIPPIAEYAHTTGRCAIIGGYVYRGVRSTLPVGAYVYGDLCTGEIFLLQGGIPSLLLDTSLTITAFGEDESKELYVIDLNGAVYRLGAWTLTMTSQNPASGVSVMVTPNDVTGQGNGATPFIRSYNDDAAVTLTAPASVGSNTFQKWQRDGVDWATSVGTTLVSGLGGRPQLPGYLNRRANLRRDDADCRRASESAET